jgi:hypothetical protein
MTKKLTSLFLLVALLVSAPVHASAIENLVGTMFVKFIEQRREGQREGCSMEYRSLFRDHTYAQGALYTLFGSFSVTLHSSGLPLMGLKVGTQRLVAKTDRTGLELTPESPHFAYLSNDNGVSNPTAIIDSMNSDTEGAKFFVFDFFSDESSDLIVGLSSSRKLNVVFNRRKNGPDLSIPLDLTVISTSKEGKRTTSPREVLAFDKCVLGLLKDVERSLNQK